MPCPPILSSMIDPSTGVPELWRCEAATAYVCSSKPISHGPREDSVYCAIPKNSPWKNTAHRSSVRVVCGSVYLGSDPLGGRRSQTGDDGFSRNGRDVRHASTYVCLCVGYVLRCDRNISEWLLRRRRMYVLWPTRLPFAYQSLQMHVCADYVLPIQECEKKSTDFHVDVSTSDQ